MHAAFGMTFNYNLEVEAPHCSQHLNIASRLCISDITPLLSSLLLPGEGVDGDHGVHLGLPAGRHGGALVLRENLSCGLD